MLENLKKRLSKFRKKASEQKDNNATNSYALIVSSEIISAVIIGTGLGYALDYYFNTKPLFIIVCLILSCVACFRSIYKLVMNKNKI